MAAAFAGCFLHSCSAEGALSVRVPVPSATMEGEFFACPADGGTISVPALQLKIDCPPARDLCPYYGRDVKPGLTVFSPAEDLVWDAENGEFRQRPVTVPTSLEAELSFENLGLSPDGVRLQAFLDGHRPRIGCANALFRSRSAFLREKNERLSHTFIRCHKTRKNM